MGNVDCIIPLQRNLLVLSFCDIVCLFAAVTSELHPTHASKWIGTAGGLDEGGPQRLLEAYPTDVVVERIYDPFDWEALGMERGTPFALAHTFRQTGPFRPNNVDRRAPGLVFTGSSTLPGVGVPMVLVSGKLAAARVDEYARERR